jgi:hypothetical protein
LELVDVEPAEPVVGLQIMGVVVVPVLTVELQQVLNVIELKPGKRRPVAASKLGFSLVRHLEAV